MRSVLILPIVLGVPAAYALDRYRIPGGAVESFAGPTSVVAESNDVGFSSEWNCA